MSNIIGVHMLFLIVLQGFNISEDLLLVLNVKPCPYTNYWSWLAIICNASWVELPLKIHIDCYVLSR